MGAKDNFNRVKENMKKNDKFIGDVLAPFEQALGLKFNKFDKHEDPHYVEPKKGGLKRKLREAERNQKKFQRLGPEQQRDVLWKKVKDKAKGVRVKDDPKLIKNSIKKKEAKKRRSQKTWANRSNKNKSKK